MTATGKLKNIRGVKRNDTTEHTSEDTTKHTFPWKDNNGINYNISKDYEQE